jgi:hypothetical protein
MASNEHDVAVQLHAFGLPRTPGTARVRDHDHGERVARALRAAGLCLGLAALSVFLPIAHFVLVPAFLLAAPIFALRRLHTRASIVGLEGICPRCNENRTFEAKGTFRPGLQATCPVCSFTLDVETDGAGAAAGA